MKINFPIILILLFCSLSQGHSQENLSYENKVHYYEALAITEELPTAEGYLIAANEFKKIIANDSTASFVHYKLGEIYSQLIVWKGEKYVPLAISCFETYKRLSPNLETDLIKENVRIKVNLKKYINQSNKKITQKYLGAWIAFGLNKKNKINKFYFYLDKYDQLRGRYYESDTQSWTFLPDFKLNEKGNICFGFYTLEIDTTNTLVLLFEGDVYGVYSKKNEF